MNVLILDGGPRDARGASCRALAALAAAEARARGHAVTTFELDSLAVKPCQGCFACWVKHPGVCAIKDDQEQVLRAMATSDIQVWITPVTFGGYSPALKKSLDRFIPNLLPFFAVREGETRHPLRYERRRSLLVLGTLPAADGEAERIFRLLAGRNALNLGSVLTRSAVFLDGEGSASADRIGEMLQAAGEAL